MQAPPGAMAIAALPGPEQLPSRRQAEDGPLHRVVRGDTLWGIAETLHRSGAGRSTREVLSAILELNPEIRNPDRIDVGQEVLLPAELPPGALGSRARRGAARGAAGTDARRSPDGTPCFRQADGAWRDVRLAAGGPTLAGAGCAVTSCAMALSKLTGAVVTPPELVARLRSAGGLDGAGRIVWARAADGLGVRAGNPRQPWSADRLRRELEAGRPVVVGVHRPGTGPGGDPAHWVCVTRLDRATDTFWANDPATGRAIELRLDPASGDLVTAPGAPAAYVSARRMVTFAAPEGPARADG